MVMRIKQIELRSYLGNFGHLQMCEVLSSVALWILPSRNKSEMPVRLLFFLSPLLYCLYPAIPDLRKVLYFVIKTCSLSELVNSHEMGMLVKL